MYTISATQIARALPEALFIQLPPDWLTSLRPEESIFQAFYAWLCKYPGIDSCSDIRQTTFIGKQLFKALVTAERTRLKKQQGLAGERLDENVAWALLEYSSLTSIGNCYLNNDMIMVIPKGSLKKLYKLTDDIYHKQHCLHIARIKSSAQGINFYYWMLAQTERPDDIGDLARYMSLDDFWPDPLAGIEDLKRYLNSQTPKGLFHQELTAAWSEYLQQYPKRNTTSSSVTLSQQLA